MGEGREEAEDCFQHTEYLSSARADHSGASSSEAWPYSSGPGTLPLEGSFSEIVGQTMLNLSPILGPQQKRAESGEEIL